MKQSNSPHDNDSSKDTTLQSVGAVLYKAHNGVCTMATGFLIAHDLVLTTAWNVYTLQEKKYNKDYGEMYFAPCPDGKITQLIKIIDSRFPKEYLDADQAGRRFYEFAVLKLESKVKGTPILTLGVNYVYNNDNKMRLVGFAARETLGVHECYESYSKIGKAEDSNTMVPQRCLSDNQLWKPVDGVLVEHQFATEGGFGGAPIVLECGEERVVVALHILRRASSDVRIARLITDDLADSLCGWAQELQSEPPFFRSLKHSYYYTTHNYKARYEDACKINDECTKANVELREENERLKLKQKALVKMLEAYQGIEEEKITTMITRLHENWRRFCEYQLKESGVSHILATEEEQTAHLTHILNELDLEHKN